MTAVDRYRKAAAAQRGIRYRIDLGLAGGRNSRATLLALAHHEQVKTAAVEALLAAGERSLIGLLVEEASLADRLRQARATGQPRPELTDRILGIRRQLRQEAA